MRKALCLALAAAFGPVMILEAPAKADSPRLSTGYIQIDPSMGRVVQPHAVSSSTIYLNRCKGGCTLTPGFNDSRTNKSSIIDGTVNIAEFKHGDDSWDTVVRCVRAMYEPFGVTVTDKDPGNVPHFEAIVAGSPSQIGIGGGVGGVAPFSCGIIDNAITFSFANIYGSAQSICETVAQESAHAFGLDHEYLCADPMTYLSGCGKKWFQDTDARCGEFSARNCQCGGSTQNSYAEIMSIFGPGVPTPPDVEIIRPKDGDIVEPGFVIEAKAEDEFTTITKVEVLVNGQSIAESSLQPYIFNAPATVDEGALEIEVRAWDGRNEMGSKRIHVIQGAPCTEDSCDGGEVCVAGRCVAGPDQEGGLGTACDSNSDCVSGLCGSGSEGKNYCAEKCPVGKDSCPGGFECIDSGDEMIGGVCWASSGGCSASGGSSTASGLLLLGLMFAGSLVRRRPRR